MDKTTLYPDSADYRKLKRLAASRRQPPAALVRDAVAEYVARHEMPLPKSIGAFSSGLKDVAERAEENLDGMGELEPQRKRHTRRRYRRDVRLLEAGDRHHQSVKALYLENRGDIATLDLRHFGAVALKHSPRLLPRDLQPRARVRR